MEKRIEVSLSLRSTVGVIFAITTLLACQAASASKKDEAKKHFQAGLSLMQMEEYEGAAVEFEASVSIFPTKNGLFNLANSYKALRRFGEAIQVYERLQQDFPGQLSEEMQQEVDKDLEDIKRLVSTLELSVIPVDARVSLDGRPVSPDSLIVLGPGKHDLKISLDGYEAQILELSVVAGQSLSKKVELEKAKEEGPEAPVVVIVDDSEKEPTRLPSQDGKDESRKGISALSWVGVGTTLALGLTSGVMWGMRQNRTNNFDKESSEYEGLDPTSENFDTEEKDAWDDLVRTKDEANAYHNSAIVLTIATGVLFALTISSIVYDYSQDDEEKGENGLSSDGTGVSFGAGPGTLGVTF